MLLMGGQAPIGGEPFLRGGGDPLGHHGGGGVYSRHVADGH